MKKLNYIGFNEKSKTSEYITVNCNLKSEDALKDFYEEIHKAKLDGQYSTKKMLAKEYHTVDIMKAFKVSWQKIKKRWILRNC